LRIISSVSSLQATLRRLGSDDPDIVDIAHEWADYILEGLDRSVTAREDGTVSADNIVDVQFDEFVADPFGVVRRVYDTFGFDLTDDGDARMRAFYADHPHEGPGVHTYSFADTGLDEGELRDRARRYQDYFDVPSERL
jgi:hypothetical protein